jgi:hypothetical protein
MRNGGLASRRLRFLILFLFLGSILAALRFVPPPVPLGMTLAALGGFVIALALLRNWQMALSAVLAPLPGIFWFGAAPYALSVSLAILMAAACQDALLKGQDSKAALWKCLPALAGTLLFALLWALHAPVQLRSLLASALAVAVFLPALVLTVTLSEDAIARGNRQRETLLRIFAHPARLAEPRWSLSFTGAGLVLAVLGYSRISHHPPAFDWLSCAAIGLIVVIFSRDGRSALAALAVSALLLVFTDGVSGTQLLFLLFVLVLARAAKDWREAGETAPSAFMHTLENIGPPVLFAGLAALVAALPRGGLLAALHAAYSLVGALILFPAFAGTLYALFPGRRSMEERYRATEHRPGKA